MSKIIQIRRDIASEWTAANPILLEGEMGIEKDSVPVRWKFGDGITAWNSLDYFTNAGWFSGVGVPSSASYNNGDYYLDTSLYNVYKKANGTWSTISNIKGAQGVLGGGNAPYGLPDCTLNGMDITTGTGLAINMAAGRVIKNEAMYNFSNISSLALSPRMASLVYAKTDDMTVNKIEAALPAVDAYTVARWVIDGSASIENSAIGVNGNTIAVSNVLTKSGTVTQVDGWLGYAGQGDGSTGKYISANYTGFPSLATERSYSILCTPTAAIISATNQYMAYYSNISIYTTSGQIILCQEGVLVYSTGYYMEANKTYHIELGYDGTKLLLYINGSLLYTSTTFTPSSAAVFYIGGTSTSSSSYIIHYVEIRNKMRTPQAIAEMSNKLLLPVFYDKTLATYPVMNTSDLALAYHEYKFDELTGTTVADSNTTTALTGTATGTTIVDSQIGLGKARKFSATTDLINCGSVALPTAFTMIFVGNIANYSVARTLFSNRNAGNTAGNIIYIAVTTGFISFQSPAGTGTFGTTAITLGKTIFLAVTINGTQATLYQDSATITNVATSPTSNTTSSPLYLGYDPTGGGANTLSGTMEYLNIIPRALSQADIASYYNALMGTSRGSVQNILPANSQSLGFVRTSSTLPIEIANDYKYGVRQGTMDGNRRKFIGWRYVAASSTYNFVNPFGSENVIVKEIWYKQNITDSTHDRIDGIYSSGYYGVYVKGVSPNNIQLYTGGYLVGSGDSYTGSTLTVGYIGFWVEVQE